MKIKKSELREIIREEIQQLNEVDVTAAIPLVFALAGGAGLKLFSNVISHDLAKAASTGITKDGVVQKVKDWWKDNQNRKKLDKIASRLKDDTEVMAMVKSPSGKGWQKLLASKLTPDEMKYLKSITRMHVLTGKHASHDIF